MWQGLVLAVTLSGVGQQAAKQVALGRMDGLEPVRAMVPVGGTAEGLTRWLCDSQGVVKSGDPFPVCFLPFGTRAVKGRDVDLTRVVRGQRRKEPACFVTISDGPMAGASVVVRKLELHEDVGRLAPTSQIDGDAPEAAATEKVGWPVSALAEALPTLAATSAKEFGEYLSGPGGGPETPVGVIQLGYTTAKVLGEVKIPSKANRDGIAGVTIKVMDGPAKGRNFIVLKFALETERDQLAAAAKKPAQNADPARRRQDELAATAAKAKARRAARANMARAREAAANDQQAKADAAYLAALPFLLEAQKSQLELMNQAERNSALQRMAGADERIARAIEFRFGVPVYPTTIRPPSPNELGGVPISSGLP